MKGLHKRFFDAARIYTAYRGRKTYCGFPPSRLWIEPTSYCNLKCVMCLNKDLQKPMLGYMDFNLYKKIIDEISGKVYDIYLHHRGESLLHPRFFDMVRYAKGHGIYTRLHTNATLLNEEKASGVIDSGLDFLSFSFDGYDKETYESIRHGAQFESTFENIVNFLRLKKKRKSKHPFTVFTIIEFSDRNLSLDSKTNFLRQFSNLPLDSIRIRRPHNWAGGYKNCKGPGRRGFLAGFNPCTFLWYSLSIFWDGTVVPCPQDFFGDLKIGNVKDTPLLDLWNSKNEIFLRNMMSKKDYINLNPCNNCDRLWRKNILGVPLDGLSGFLRDNLLGYRRKKVPGTFFHGTFFHLF